MMMRRRRPLMRGAMVAGAGYMAGKSAANRKAAEADQNERIAALEAQQQPAAPPPPPPAAAAPAPAAAGTDDTIAQLKELKELLDAGVLTQEEFDAQKQKILGG